ncbi:MFS transporter [Solirubrobacter phytolaccae]|uniref:MFS transporter n=1 Tax=Solirubrobacter phytolaccae TaxID=1404360 RepID=A0A9X3NB49_9ACTN|nr:MFS transporter [Solirubrobacter phytolaccae]MDA0181537.1 MFS transporter [Solirubrobacter phytolaccae]
MTLRALDGFAPLRGRAFRTLWLAQFASNIGGWMQTVGAQWLMLSLSGSAAYLAFVQSAASLPVLLFAIPAGVAGDLFDRRRLLLVCEAAMALASLALAGLAVAGLVTPWILLALLFAIGAGQAWSAPTWQSLQPELVPAEQRPQAIALGSVNQNLARAIGPAIGGVLIAVSAPSTTFFVNAASFLVVIVAVARWRERTRDLAATTLPREHALAATRSSGRYVAHSPLLKAILLRAGVFVFFASAVWALLPSVATRELGLGSGGYGLLLGCVGIGAVAGAVALPAVRAALRPERVLALGTVLVAGAAAVLAAVPVVAVACVALVVAGTGWILSLATLNSTFQASLPGWVKARGLAFYLVVFQGGNAIGSAVIGLLAARFGVTGTLGAAAALLALSPLIARLAPIPDITPDELRPAGDVPASHALATDVGGPVMVTLEWRARPGEAGALAATIAAGEPARRRTGATAWSSWADAEDPDRIVEQFVVTSALEHQRQHERMTVRDRARIADAAALAVGPPVTTHWTHAQP